MSMVDVPLLLAVVCMVWEQSRPQVSLTGYIREQMHLNVLLNLKEVKPLQMCSLHYMEIFDYRMKTV